MGLARNVAARVSRLARRVGGIPEVGMPASRPKVRLVIGAHIAKKGMRGAFRGEALTRVLLNALSEAIFFEMAFRNFGPASMIRGLHGFFPHIFMPDFHGPHFDEALQRIVFSKKGPNILYFSLTGSCPCRCEYCFAGAGGAQADDIGDAAALSVATSVARLRIPLVNISGGEPLSRYSRLLKTVRALSAGSEVRMFTSGIGLTQGRLHELREAGLKGLFVSLDGDDPKAFDHARRTPGAFDAAVNALTLSAREDMLTFINCVVDRTRFRDREQIVSFLRFVEKIDPRIVVNFLPQLATGRGADAVSFDRPDQCDELAQRIVSTAESIGRPVSMLFGKVDRFIGCPGAGGKLMNVDISGNMTVCISKASLGNILREPFEVIYERFVSHCRRLKVGFFCCDVSKESDGGLLDLSESREALDQFYARSEDADWQRILDRYGWLFRRLFEKRAGDK
ncbi:MAG: radical SAM protein [Deltaproteobacteria bacterium]|nr:radical SAM protein [Deltaproteobacteria bacterium]